MTHDHAAVLTVRSTEDLLALVPCLMGFHPQRSLVLLTIGRAGSFHARVDLPSRRSDIDSAVACLVAPVRQQRIDRVAVIAYTDDHALARATVARLRRELQTAGTGLVDAVRADGRRWFPLVRTARAPHGRSYDVSTHPLLAEAVLRGQVVRASREELVASIRRDPTSSRAVLEAMTGQGPAEAAAESAWALRCARTAVGRGQTTWPVDQSARLLRALSAGQTADAWLLALRREDAGAWVRLLSELARAAPDGFVAPAATLLGFAAWLTGDGALAWCAVDRAVADDPNYPLTGVLADLLMGAVPPTAWDRIETGAGCSDGA